MDQRSGMQQLSPTLAALGEDPVEALERLARDGWRCVQLSATQPGVRPREMDRSARRGLQAMLRRLELAATGIDLWIPGEHFESPQHCDRAAAAAIAAVEMAAELERCPVSLAFPAGDSAAFKDVLEAILKSAEACEVKIADHAFPFTPRERVSAGLDPAVVINEGGDPAPLVISLGKELASARLCDVAASGERIPISSKGRLDWPAYRVALAGAGWEQPIVLDARQWPDAWAGLTASRALWEQPW